MNKKKNKKKKIVLIYLLAGVVILYLTVLPSDFSGVWFFENGVGHSLLALDLNVTNESVVSSLEDLSHGISHCVSAAFISSAKTLQGLKKNVLVLFN